MMPVFTVSFRIHEDSTYQKRYDSFVEQLKVSRPDYWEETTSFAIVRTAESIDDFCHRLYYKSEIYDSKDMFLVMDVDSKSARARGPIKYPHTLQDLVPFVKILTS